MAQVVCPPEILGALGGSGNDVVVSGSTAYMASGEGGLQVISFTDPVQPGLIQSIGSHELRSWRTLDLHLAGNLLFVAGSRGLDIVDVSTHGEATPIGRFPASTADGALCIAAEDGLAAMGEFSGRVRLIDVTDPTEPLLISDFSTGGRNRGIDLVGGLVYIGDSEALHIFDAADPTAPVSLVRLNLPGQPGDLQVIDNLAYVTVDDEGLAIVDVTDPMVPQLVGLIDTGVGIFSGARDVDVRDGIAYVTNGAASSVLIDVTNPSAPQQLGSVRLPADAGFGNGVAAVGDLAVFATSNRGFEVVDVSDPFAPLPLGSLDTPDESEEVVVRGSFAYQVDDFTDGLTIYSVAEPTQPDVISNLSFSDRAHGVAVSGDLVLVAADEAGLYIIDASDPAEPFVVGRVNPDERAQLVFAHGSLAYVLETGDGGNPDYLRIVDFTDSSVPVSIGRVQINHPHNATLEGDRLYIATGPSSGIQIVDVSDPVEPVVLGTVGDGSEGTHGEVVAVRGSFLYTNRLDWGGDSSLRVFEVSDPENPVLINELLGMRITDDLDIAGDRMVSVSSSGTTYVFDIADPSNPVVLRELVHIGTGAHNAVDLVGDLAYIAGDGDGLRIIDIEPDCPTPCPADLNGDGLLDLDDISLFIDAFLAMGFAADLAEPIGLWDLADLTAFAGLFVAGCP